MASKISLLSTHLSLLHFLSLAGDFSSFFFLAPGGRVHFIFFPLSWWERIKVRGQIFSFSIGAVKAA
jgi:hypothetical protein